MQEAQLDESRRQIIDVIRAASEPLTIKQIRSSLSDDGISKSPDSVRKTVQRMCNADQLDKVEGNRYRLYVSHLSDHA